MIGLSTVAHGHQGCSVEAAFDKLLGEATIEHVSEALLLSLQHDVKTALHSVELSSPARIADTIVDNYRVLRGILSYAGIKLPQI
ncbi:hypothetical protein IWW41_002861 [Coemansia sp. RSA 2522]|nr:hypothetical protein IWW41_002861 [Coemansia sp. RSA 2522]